MMMMWGFMSSDVTVTEVVFAIIYASVMRAILIDGSRFRYMSA